jgi:hypothetical protein
MMPGRHEKVYFRKVKAISFPGEVMHAECVSFMLEH